MYDVIIIGGGPAGMSSLLWSQRLELHSLLLESQSTLGGQLLSVHNPLIDYLGIPVDNGKQLQAKFVNHLQSMNCNYKCGVEVQDFLLREKRIITNQGEYKAHALILALGSKDKRLGIPGESEMIARNEVYSASKDKSLFQGQTVAVIGGGDRALEGAIILANHGAFVLLIHRNEQFRARQEYIKTALQHPNIKIHTNTKILKILSTSQVTGMMIETNAIVQTISVKAVFVRIGVKPQTEAFKDQLKIDSDGYIQTNYLGETSLPNVFAVGDICTRPLLSCVSYSVAQGTIAAKTISNRKK